MRGKIQNVLFIVLGLLTGALVTILLFSWNTSINECFKKYPLTNRALACEDYEESLEALRELDTKFDDATELYIASGKAERISVWTRDLNTRLWASSNEFEQYAPASLFKVPVMIAYFKLAEIQPALLDTELEYQPRGIYEEQNFSPQQRLVAGQRYRVADLIERMIINSDNEAAVLLIEHLMPQIYEDILLDLGIKVPTGDGTTDFVTVKTYANIYRILYNSSYLTRDYSQRALDILSKTNFKGIQEAIPDNVVVAHKFGERRVLDTSGKVQKLELHDCGIIYKDGRPYSLCIMTEGKSFDDLIGILKDLSAIAYEHM